MNYCFENPFCIHPFSHIVYFTSNMSAFFVILAADIPNNPLEISRQTQIDCQNLLFKKFCSRIDRAYMEERMEHHTIREVCDWEVQPNFDIGCTDGLINHILFRALQHGNFLIEYLPSTIERVSIRRCKQNYQLQTRRLPKQMRWLNLNNNLLFGTIDFQHLPPRMVTFDVSRNKISGPIILRNLPETMQNICIFKNSIQQDVLYYDALPETLTVVSLGENAIRSIRPIDEDMPEKNIFYGRKGRSDTISANLRED